MQTTAECSHLELFSNLEDFNAYFAKLVESGQAIERGKEERFHLEFDFIKNRYIGQTYVLFALTKDKVVHAQALYVFEKKLDLGDTSSPAIDSWESAILPLKYDSFFLNEGMVSFVFRRLNVSCISIYIPGNQESNIPKMSGLKTLGYRRVLKKYSDYFDGEIGHNQFDSIKIVLEDDMDSFFRKLDTRDNNLYSRKKKAYNERRLEREYGIKKFYHFKGTANATLDALVDKVVAIDGKSWQHDDDGYYLSKIGRDELGKLFAFLKLNQKLWLTILECGEVPVAYVFGVVRNTTIQDVFLSYDMAFKKHSPGRVVLLDFIELCIGNGLTEIELAGTTHGYKKGLADVFESVYEMIVFNNTKEGKYLYKCKRMFNWTMF